MKYIMINVFSETITIRIGRIYFTPKGRSINGKGITPDVKVEYENNEENPDADNQLDKAVEEVKAQMK